MAAASRWRRKLPYFFALQVKLNLKRPGNLAYLASASVNLADLKSSHAQLVKQKDIVTVLCQLASHPKLVEVSSPRDDDHAKFSVLATKKPGISAALRYLGHQPVPTDCVSR